MLRRCALVERWKPGRRGRRAPSVSSHYEVSHAESHQSERKDQFISHSQRRRELVDEDDDAQDHRPPQTGHPDKDHGHHERRAASKAAEAVARACDSGAPHQVEGQRPMQRAQLAAASLARPFDRTDGVNAGQSQRQSNHHTLVGQGILAAV